METNTKPIFIIGVPPNRSNKLYLVARAVKGMRKEYHILVYPISEGKELKFEMFNAKEALEVDFLEIQEKINKELKWESK